MRLILSLMALASLGIGIACNNAAAPIPVKTEPAKAEKKVDEHGHVDEAPRITIEEAKKDFDGGNAVFVDTRAEVQYRQERIKGAINIPMEAVETKYKDIPTGKKIIAYCS
jgi:3-mercaptopyruvate sulfurtransferase SseA